MRSLRARVVGLAGAVGLVIAACGGAGVQQTVDPTGGEVCLGQRRVCIDVPSKALTKAVVLRITSGADAPGAALSEVFDIAAQPQQPVTFEVPAKVSISLDAVDATNVPSESLLRVFTRDSDTQAWVALESPAIDRVRREVTGFTRHLSPFVVLRADLTPDGELPMELDPTIVDSGRIIVPPIPDAGRPDAGRPDAGRADSGTALDAGAADAGAPDAGSLDAGIADAGPVDAGLADASAPDSGTLFDAGAPDAGADADAGAPDAGITEADGGCDGGLDGGGC